MKKVIILSKKLNNIAVSLNLSNQQTESFEILFKSVNLYIYNRTKYVKIIPSDISLSLYVICCSVI